MTYFHNKLQIFADFDTAQKQQKHYRVEKKLLQRFSANLNWPKLPPF